jgi:hypothetical protein
MTADKRNVKPWQGTKFARRIASAAAVFACLAALGASSATAAESAWPTAQATAANAEWVPFLDPPPKPAAICLVDSGVNITPDTPADSPDGPIVKRLALDGGTGEAAGTSWEALHGTRMAMAAAAPKNDWGTIGMWPHLRIISVRAMPAGTLGFPFDDYRRAIGECVSYAARYNVVATNLSLSCSCIQTADERLRLSNKVAQAHTYANMSVVASAGNDGAPVAPPASEEGVLSVGAATVDGGLCAFSNRGDGLDIAAPGCGLHGTDTLAGIPTVGWTGGTSAAAAQVATAIALVRSYRADLGWQAAEELVMQSRPSDKAAGIDVAKLFELAGLETLVASAYGTSRPRPRGCGSSERPAPDPSRRGRGFRLRLGALPPHAETRAAASAQESTYCHGKKSAGGCPSRSEGPGKAGRLLVRDDRASDAVDERRKRAPPCPRSIPSPHPSVHTSASAACFPCPIRRA